jgi:hypothetical protein
MNAGDIRFAEENAKGIAETALRETVANGTETALRGDCCDVGRS